ncbi:MAG: ATP-binding protein [Treponema sp.]|jgi:predicted AAA+ superfamily ATPase|nr:ATP-binding protein [Treponema sp.]
MKHEVIEAAQTALADIAGLVLFSQVRDKPLMRAFKDLLEQVVSQNPGRAEGSLVHSWAVFMASLVEMDMSCREAAAPQGYGDFYHALAWMTLRDDNLFTRTAEVHPEAAGLDSFPRALRTLAQIDLSRLGRIAAFDIPGLGFYIGALLREGFPFLDQPAHAIEEEARLLWAAEGNRGGAYPILHTLFPEHTDWALGLPDLTAYIQRTGAGDLGLYRSFRWAGFPDLGLKPVLHPDPVQLSSLAGYEEPRSVVITNTLRFLEGKPANNLLLYGDRGTGKSATVKAVCNEYAHRGLRLLEVPKGKLVQLPEILETLRCRGLRFIIFIDDLSFEKTDDSFTALKRLLEGGIEAKPSQAVIYATSNRRHLVKEYAADRPTTAMAADALATGDMRAFDTLQEQFSLADRFGLTVVFAAPGQEEFLHIAESIARERGIIRDPPQGEVWKPFRENALRWERWFNGRSPRTAVQYVDWVAGGAGFPWE